LSTSTIACRSTSWRKRATCPRSNAFLVGEAEFEDVLGRIRDKRLDHWADPARTRPGEINHHFGGRGVYFPDPDGHLLEAITRPYGSEAETEAS
jgi:catechol 2,3-dioxygenase-like lactoylglutathione lyase family enzyme